MAGYRRVNYYELCRLCTSSEGTKMHIFREEGRRRQLPTKIQICLPLQVCEDDSLPKIICSHCVDKLESFYDFRESCVNAEAMLESYFTSLRYSDDFSREGKVYVKDESPPKKKSAEADKVSLKPALATDGLNSLVQAAGIQIVSDAEGTRVQQYKCAMQMQPGAGGPTMVEATEARYTYDACTAANTRTPDPVGVANPVLNTPVAKVEDGSTQCSETDFNNKQQSPESSDEGEVQVQQQQTAVAFATTTPGTEMLVHFNFNNKSDREFLRAEDQAALQRSSIAQIGEFLRMKSVNLEGPTPTALIEVASPSRPCDRCGKVFATMDELGSHACHQDPAVTNDSVSGATQDKNAPGNFACEICGKPFKRKEHLFQHRKLHTGERPYVCTVCSKAFSRKEHLVRHAVSHTGQKMHACDMCGKSFSRKDNLHKHRKTHGIAGPYSCETCGKSFVVKHYYLMHRGSHAQADGDNPLPYKCDICGKGFAGKQHLSTHRQRHRNKGQQVTPGGAAGVASEDPLAISTGAPPLTTINNAALLAPNILQHVPPNNAPMIQVSTAATAYLCAPTTPTDLLETYKRLHSA